MNQIVTGALCPVTFFTYMKNITIFLAIACITTAAQVNAQDISFERFASNPIIHEGLLPKLEGDNINGPSLINDRTELHNLAATHQDKVKELAALYDAWAAKAGVVEWASLQKQ